MSNNKKTPNKTTSKKVVDKKTAEKSTAQKKVAPKKAVSKTAATKSTAPKKAAAKKVSEEEITPLPVDAEVLSDFIDRAGLSRLVAQASEVVDADKAEKFVDETLSAANSIASEAKKKIAFWRRIFKGKNK